jgi:hypothetical protein
MNGRIRIGTAITAAAAMLALAGSAVAQTGQQPQGLSAQQSAGDAARGDALNKRYHLGKYSPAAQAGPKPAGMTTQQWQAELARGDALNERYGLGAYADPPLYTPAMLAAHFNREDRLYQPRAGSTPQRIGVPLYTPAMLAAHFNREDRLYQRRAGSTPQRIGDTSAVTTSAPQRVVSAAPGGFDWGAAGIGAGAAIGLALLATGMAVIVRQNRRSQLSTSS